MTSNSYATLWLLAVVLAATLPGQKDLRDAVTLDNGKVIRGRVLTPYAEDELLIMQGSKRVRIARRRVASMVTVLDQQREFFRRRGQAAQTADAQWQLAAWAASVQLNGMARLAAHSVLFIDPDYEKAHELLGHRQRGKSWLWPKGSNWLSLKRFEQDSSSWGRALEIEAEHFRIRSNGGMQRGVDALFDLERLYLFWFDEFGAALDLHEALELMDILVWNDEDKFPGWSGARLSYFIPKPFDDASYTFYPKKGDRPHDLFVVGSQHILYRCLALDPNLGDTKNRLCAWLEIGIGQWMQSQLEGPAGQVEPVFGGLDLASARAVLMGKRYSVKNILHLNLRDHFYGGVGGYHQVHWASVYSLVAFLMDEDAFPGGSKKLMTFLHDALRNGKGDSSSAFDDAMGQRAERLEEPWLRWLEHRVGMKRRRKS